MAPPINDNWANAVELEGYSGTETVRLSEATTEAGEQAGSAWSNLAQTVWYAITPDIDGHLLIDTAGSVAEDPSFAGPDGYLDTTLAIWTGTSLAGLTELDSNDDTDGSTATSSLLVPVDAGTTYYISVGTFDAGYAGTAHIAWSVLIYDVGVETDVMIPFCAPAHSFTAPEVYDIEERSAAAVDSATQRLIGISGYGDFANYTGGTPPTDWAPWDSIRQTKYKSAGNSSDVTAGHFAHGGLISAKSDHAWLDADVAIGDTFTWRKSTAPAGAGVTFDQARWLAALLAVLFTPDILESGSSGSGQEDANIESDLGTGTSVALTFPGGRSYQFEWVWALVVWNSHLVSLYGPNRVLPQADSSWFELYNQVQDSCGLGIALFYRYVWDDSSDVDFDASFSGSVDWSIAMGGVRAAEADLVEPTAYDLNVCGEKEGEILTEGGEYLGVLGFDTGMPDLGWADYCTSGLILWLWSPWWEPPCVHGAHCADWPISLFSTWLAASNPDIVADPSGPPGLEASPAFRITGNGRDGIGIAFWPMDTDWFPELGSCWTMEGWVKSDLADVNVQVGFGTDEWGFWRDGSDVTVAGEWVFFQQEFVTIAQWGPSVYASERKVPIIWLRGDALVNDEIRTVNCLFNPSDEVTLEKAMTYGYFNFKCVHLYPCTGPPPPQEPGLHLETAPLLLPHRDPHLTL